MRLDATFVMGGSALSKKDKKAQSNGVAQWISNGGMDEFLNAPLVPPPEGIEVNPKLLEGALVAHAMELQKGLGMPYDEPQVAVEQMGLPWDKVKALLPYWKGLAASLHTTRGRPKKTVDDLLSHPGSQAVVNGMLDFLLANPGCVRPGPTRQRKVYSAEFREHILRLLGPGGPGDGMTLAQAAHITSIPANTLSAWKHKKKRKSRPKDR